VLHVLCDLTVAADTAVFGQNGPRVGSFDVGFGTAYLARAVGEKRAREIWMLCRRYDARTAERWGLVNQVVPAAELRAEVRRWADEILALSPTALRFVKQSLNADSEHMAGIAQLGFSGLNQFLGSEEAREGVEAFVSKRAPDFAPYRAAAST
jgi:2-ketocyclohexanecarboxyl-CoA hydrolase